MPNAETSVPGVDRREYFRVRYFADVEIEWGSSRMHGRTADLSLGGMLIEVENPLWLGAEFQARLSLGKTETLEIPCVVKQIVPGIGMGVEFVDLKPRDRTRLRSLIESVPH